MAIVKTSFERLYPKLLCVASHQRVQLGREGSTIGLWDPIGMWEDWYPSKHGI